MKVHLINWVYEQWNETKRNLETPSKTAEGKLLHLRARGNLANSDCIIALPLLTRAVLVTMESHSFSQGMYTILIAMKSLILWCELRYCEMVKWCFDNTYMSSNISKNKLKYAQKF